jgi:hypothetical protein
MDERETRVAENEATTRATNEQIEQAHSRSPDDYFRIICECGRSDRTRVMAIAIGEHEEVCSDARDFAVVRTQVTPDVEMVIRDAERFTVVRKREGMPTEIAEERDPTS